MAFSPVSRKRARRVSEDSDDVPLGMLESSSSCSSTSSCSSSSNSTLACGSGAASPSRCAPGLVASGYSTCVSGDVEGSAGGGCAATQCEGGSAVADGFVDRWRQGEMKVCKKESPLLLSTVASLGGYPTRSVAKAEASLYAPSLSVPCPVKRSPSVTKPFEKSAVKRASPSPAPPPSSLLPAKAPVKSIDFKEFTRELTDFVHNILDNKVVPAAFVKDFSKIPKNGNALAAKGKVNKYAKTEENFEPINRWWEKSLREIEDTTRQWVYLEHNGMQFSPPYLPHRVQMKYEGKPVDLNAEAEQVANHWCGVLESEYATKKKFIGNFWQAFLAALPAGHLVKEQGDFTKCDFQPIKDFLDEEKERKKNMTKQEKEELKLKKQEADAPYTHALVDYLREKVGNSKVEPPGLFRGRGDHPKQGQLKRPIDPEDITINCAPDAPVASVDGAAGHCWGDVVHDDSVTWLAYYKDTINDQFKYMYLSAATKFKQRHDLLKYEKARKLKLYVEKIRQDYTRKMKSSELQERQLATATYLIDFLALRVGGEKDKDEEADTVGCCSIRVEHVTFDVEAQTITLDFLGKDSIRYLNTVKIDRQAFKNMYSFRQNKKPQADIFDKISSTTLNQYLKELMPGLSAKVFRTYNASITLEQQLALLSENKIDMADPKALEKFYNDANREVAILCNHQRAVSRQHGASMERMKLAIAATDEDLRECHEYLTFLRKGGSQFRFKSTETDKDGNPRKRITKQGMSEESCKNKIKQLKLKRDTQKFKMQDKEDNKTVALGTSKINYMDPRITVAFCKKCEMPIERFFNKSLRSKFPWAMFAKADFVF
eukprot:GHVT01022308.1.p1 GENE.GHVT01022308.1~~GHVT01022308.1.p1  ORF type:complete len:829 (-),score=188.51 GHVT01022308.1:1784-4270(-)